MRWFWICLGLQALTACSRGDAPGTDVASQSHAVVAAAKGAPGSEGPALSSAAQSRPPLLPSARTVEGCRNDLPPESVPPVALRSADPFRGHSQRRGVPEDAVEQSKASYRVELQEFDRRQPIQPKSVLDGARASDGQSREAEFANEMARRKTELDQLGADERAATYASIKNRILGGGK